MNTVLVQQMERFNRLLHYFSHQFTKGHQEYVHTLKHTHTHTHIYCIVGNFRGAIFLCFSANEWFLVIF